LPSVLWHCWLGSRKGIRPVKKLSGGVLTWLFVWSDVQICIWSSWCHWHSLSLAPLKSRLVLPFWYRLTWVFPDKESLNGCVCACACMRACVHREVCWLGMDQRRMKLVIFYLDQCFEFFNALSLLARWQVGHPLVLLENYWRLLTRIT